MHPDYPTCAACPYDWSERVCRRPDGKGPDNCPTLLHADLKKRALDVLNDQGLREFACQASIQEAEGYGGREKGYANVEPIKPRIVETVEFARRMGMTRLGIIFCVGLRQEAGIVHEILETNGFEAVSILCKAGRAPKEELGLGRSHQIDMQAKRESMCNPILQAEIANHYQVELNILLGLCVGHDSLFIKQAEGFCTVLAVKDRLLGHNPLAAIYQYHGYYRRLKTPLP
jgi:uncharacterized metal-binding protein